MLLAEVAAVSRAVAESTGRLEKAERMASCLRRLAPEEAAIGVAYLGGELPGGRLGVGWSAIEASSAGEPAAEASLSLLEVDRELARIRKASGPGSGGERRRLLAALLARATAEERDFLIRLLLGQLRQGALEGVMVEAAARAAEVAVADVRRALMLAGDLGRVAAAALSEGRAGLARFDLVLFRPVLPMLAQPADDLHAVFERMPEAAFELKLDGARVQVHKAGDEVRVYSRSRSEVTGAVPELVEGARALPARELVLDGEAIALRPGGGPHRFQTTMRRFGRRLDVERLRRELPLSVFYFDCLFLDGESLLDRPTRERLAALERVIPAELAVERLVTGDPEAAAAMWRRALDLGHEGLMAKALDAPYAAGGRGKSWLKLKSAHTLDLVVIAVEWGSGRRRGLLSNLHLGARDPGGGGFVMVGKTFKGMTDEMLAWQTEKLLALETGREGHVVRVRPELVVEIAIGDVQESPRYPAGLALRFARVKGYRPDKRPEEADTIDIVRAIHARGA